MTPLPTTTQRDIDHDIRGSEAPIEVHTLAELLRYLLAIALSTDERGEIVWLDQAPPWLAEAADRWRKINATSPRSRRARERMTLALLRPGESLDSRDTQIWTVAVADFVHGRAVALGVLIMKFSQERESAASDIKKLRELTRLCWFATWFTLPYNRDLCTFAANRFLSLASGLPWAPLRRHLPGCVFATPEEFRRHMTGLLFDPDIAPPGETGGRRMRPAGTRVVNKTSQGRRPTSRTPRRTSA